MRFQTVDLVVSFRSTAAVLDAVDWVFGEEAAAAGQRADVRLAALVGLGGAPERREGLARASVPVFFLGGG